MARDKRLTSLPNGLFKDSRMSRIAIANALHVLILGKDGIGYSAKQHAAYQERYEGCFPHLCAVSKGNRMLLRVLGVGLPMLRGGIEQTAGR